MDDKAEELTNVELPPMDQEEEASNSNVFKIDNSPFELSLRIDNFSDDKDEIKFIKAVEKMVRFSPEYRLWVDYIVETLGQNKCEFTGEVKGECPVDVHHHPICLFTIVKTIVDDKIQKKIPFCTFDIAREVIEMHFQNRVGYVLILSSLHEKYHNGFMQIPIEFVSGDYKYLLTNYEMDKEEYSRILLLCAVHKEDIVQKWNKDNYPGLTDQSTEVKQIEHTETILVAESPKKEEITDTNVLDMINATVG